MSPLQLLLRHRHGHLVRLLGRRCLLPGLRVLPAPAQRVVSATRYSRSHAYRFVVFCCLKRLAAGVEVADTCCWLLLLSRRRRSTAAGRCVRKSCPLSLAGKPRKMTCDVWHRGLWRTLTSAVRLFRLWLLCVSCSGVSDWLWQCLVVPVGAMIVRCLSGGVHRRMC